MTPYPLVLDDGQRNLSRRPAQTNDCAVRALAIVTDLDYDEVYDTLARSRRKPCQGYDTTAWLKRRAGRAFDGTFTPVPARKLSALFFGRLYPKGRFLLETDSHTWALIDGTHRDLWRVKKPLTGAWRFVLDTAGQAP